MSSDLDIKFPEINYDATYADLYKKLRENPDSPFRGQTYADIFLFAMALAKKNGTTPKELATPAKLPAAAFNETMRAFMRSIMIDERGDVYAIRDNTELRRMCEKYANAGIEMLYMKIMEKPEEKYGDDVLTELIQS